MWCKKKSYFCTLSLSAQVSLCFLLLLELSSSFFSSKSGFNVSAWVSMSDKHKQKELGNNNCMGDFMTCRVTQCPQTSTVTALFCEQPFKVHATRAKFGMLGVLPAFLIKWASSLQRSSIQLEILHFLWKWSVNAESWMPAEKSINKLSKLKVSKCQLETKS